MARQCLDTASLASEQWASTREGPDDLRDHRATFVPTSYLPSIVLRPFLPPFLCTSIPLLFGVVLRIRVRC